VHQVGQKDTRKRNFSFLAELASTQISSNKTVTDGKKLSLKMQWFCGRGLEICLKHSSFESWKGLINYKTESIQFKPFFREHSKTHTLLWENRGKRNSIECFCRIFKLSFLEEKRLKLKKKSQFLSFYLPHMDDLNGSVGSNRRLETQRSRVRIPDKSRFFPHVKEVVDIGLTNRPRKRSKFV
jgi:hypothetical protein